jgi:hypothetical protein
LKKIKLFINLTIYYHKELQVCSIVHVYPDLQVFKVTIGRWANYFWSFKNKKIESYCEKNIYIYITLYEKVSHEETKKTD